MPGSTQLCSEGVLLGVAPFLGPAAVAALSCASPALRGVMLQLDTLWSLLLAHRPFECAPDMLAEAAACITASEHADVAFGPARPHEDEDEDGDGDGDGEQQQQQQQQQKKKKKKKQKLRRNGLWELFKELARAAVAMQREPSSDVDAPLQLLSRFPRARGLALQALQCVTSACESDFHRLVACGKGAHVIVHHVLSSFPMDQQLQIAGLRALVLLCRPIGAPEGSIVRRHPSTPWSSSPVLGDVVIDAMKNHADSPQVLCNAAWAASNIALSHKQWAWLVEHNINELLVDVLERFPNDERLQLRGLSAFINILRPETDLTRIARVACAAHEMCKNPSGKVSERAVWVLYIISKWRPHLLRNQRVRQCAIDVLRQDRHLVTFATSLASSVLRHVFNEEPLTLIAQLETSEVESNESMANEPPLFAPAATLTTMAT